MPLNRRLIIGSAIASLATPYIRPRAATEPIRLHTMRTPSYEYYAGVLAKAIPGVGIDATLMPVDKLLELINIDLSSKSDGFDIIYAGGGATIAQYARSGWLEPLDAYWEKYRVEFQLDGFPPDALDLLTYEGKLYGIPTLANTELLFYRTDLLQQQGASPPTTVDGYVELARALNTPRRSGVCLRMKRVDASQATTNWALNAVGDGWFDDRLHPVFNSPRGIQAIEMLRTLIKYAVPGATAQGNDESTVLMQQDQAAMQIMWVTRAAAMDDPRKSNVVGKIGFAPPPGGGGATAYDSFAISSFSRRDKDLMFRLIATATSEANMRAGAAVLIPPRTAVQNDPELAAKYRFFPVVAEAVKSARRLPRFPEFPQTADITTQYVNQAVIGQLPVKQAMDMAAHDVTELLTRRGYYK